MTKLSNGKIWLDGKPSEIIMLPKDAKLIEFDEGFLSTDQLDPKTVFAIEADNFKYYDSNHATALQAMREFETTITMTVEGYKNSTDAILDFLGLLDDARQRFEETRMKRVGAWLGYAVMAALAILTAILVVPNVR